MFLCLLVCSPVLWVAKYGEIISGQFLAWEFPGTWHLNVTSFDDGFSIAMFSGGYNCHVWLVVSNILISHILGIMIPTDCHIVRRGWNHQPDCHVRLHVGLSEVKIQPASMAQVESLRDRKSDLARKVDFEQEHCWHWKMLKHPNQIYWILICHPYHSLSILSSYYSSWAQKWTSPFFTKMNCFFDRLYQC